MMMSANILKYDHGGAAVGCCMCTTFVTGLVFSIIALCMPRDGGHVLAAIFCLFCVFDSFFDTCLSMKYSVNDQTDEDRNENILLIWI